MIFLLLHESEVKQKMSVNNNKDIIQVYLGCMKITGGTQHVYCTTIKLSLVSTCFKISCVFCIFVEAFIGYLCIY